MLSFGPRQMKSQVATNLCVALHRMLSWSSRSLWRRRRKWLLEPCTISLLRWRMGKPRSSMKLRSGRSHGRTSRSCRNSSLWKRVLALKVEFCMLLHYVDFNQRYLMQQSIFLLLGQVEHAVDNYAYFSSWVITRWMVIAVLVKFAIYTWNLNSCHRSIEPVFCLVRYTSLLIVGTVQCSLLNNVC